MSKLSDLLAVRDRRLSGIRALEQRARAARAVVDKEKQRLAPLDEEIARAALGDLNHVEVFVAMPDGTLRAVSAESVNKWHSREAVLKSITEVEVVDG